MHVVPSVTALADLAGTDLGTTAWQVMDQSQIDTFAPLTGDRQWIHVDTERASTGPFGTTIAHGMLTLSFVPLFIEAVVRVDNAGFGLNYGFERIRFTAPVRSGSRIRGAVRCVGTEAVTGGVRARFGVTVELEGSARPALVAEQAIVWLE